MITNTTTTRLRLRLRDRLTVYLAARDPLVVIASIVLPLIALLVIGAQLSRTILPPTVVATQPTPPLPIIIYATAPAIVVPTPAPIQVSAQLPNTFARAVVAYDAPDGAALGAIEQGRAYQVLARFGAEWLQADVVGSGVVWLRQADVFDLPVDLADLQPPPAPAVVYVAAPQVPAEQPPAAPELAAPTPAPEQQYAVTSAPAAPPQQTVILDRQQWAMDAQQAWAQQQWRDEHCVGDVCVP